MALFQNSVLNKYLKTQDKILVAKAYKKFVNYFLNSTIQENIRNSKVEIIDQPDREIDQMIYELYGFTEVEIVIVK